MGLKKVKNVLINEGKYVYPYPELIIQSTRNANHVSQLGSDAANNEHGYIYFYADSDWKKNPNVYIGESKNSIQSRHNSTHKNTEWFASIKYPFIGVINSPNLPWDTDTRRAIESKTVYKLHSLGIKVVNGANSTWTNGGTVHPNVNNQYVEDVSDIIVDYITHHTGYSNNKIVLEKIQNKKDYKLKTEASTSPSKKGFTYNPVTLDILIAEGILSECELFSIPSLYPAKAYLTKKGTIIFDGDEYTSISSSALAAIRKVRPEAISTNGWDFWGILQSDGQLIKISEYRNKYNK